MATTLPQGVTGPVGASPTILNGGSLTPEEIAAQKSEASLRATNPVYDRAEQSAAAQQGFFANMGTTIKSSFGAQGLRNVQDEQQQLAEAMGLDNPAPFDLAGYTALAGTYVMAAFGATADSWAEKPDYNKETSAKELTAGIPVEYWDDIMQHDTLETAVRERGRIAEQLQRKGVLSAQLGGTSKIAMLAAGFIDVDLPFTLASGGMFGGIKAARAGYALARTAGAGEKLAMRFSSMAGGISSGVTTNTIAAAYGEVIDPTVDTQFVLHSILMGGVTSGLINTAAFHNFAGATKDMRSYDRVFNDQLAKMREINLKNAVENPYHKVDDALDHRLDENALDTEDVIIKPGDESLGEADQIMTPQEAMRYENADLPGPKPTTSAGAAVVHPRRPMKTPLGTIRPDEEIIIQRASDTLDRSGGRQELQDLDNSTWGQIMTGDWAKRDQGWLMYNAKRAVTRGVNAMGNDVMDLYRSKSNVANWLAMTLFENPSSYGRGVVASTAATLDRMAEGRIASTLKDFGTHEVEWAKRTNNTMQIAGKATGLHISDAGRRALYRELYLNMNDLRLGRAARSSQDPLVMRMVGMLGRHAEESLKWLKGKEVNGAYPSAVKGTEGLDIDHGYIPQRLNGGALTDLVTKSKRTTEKDIVDAMTEGYARQGIPQDIAEKIAKANVARAWRRDMDVDTSLIDLLTEDGRGFLRERLLLNMNEKEADDIITHLTGMNAMAGQPGFTKHRNDLDMDVRIRTTDGTDLRLVDLMDTDLMNMLHNYRKGVSGSGALARKGIRSRKDRDLIFSAQQAEQLSLGEAITPTDKLKAMFSDFDSGPQHGYSAGTVNKGIDPYLSVAKRFANLSLLNTLGIPQLMEASQLIAADGLASFMEHGMAKAGLNNALKNINREALEDLAPLMGDIGMDHVLFRQHTNMDELNLADASDWLAGVNRYMGNLSYVQSFTSLYNTVITQQHQLAATLLSNKVFRTIKAGQVTERMRVDLGISDRLYNYLERQIQNGNVEFATVNGTEYVNRFNFHKWDNSEMADDFGAIMVRGMGNTIQRSAAGEQDVWARSNFGAIVTHLKNFPLTALPKQLMRNGRHGFDAQTKGVLMYGMATAYLGLALRDWMTGKERSAVERARDAIGYSPMTGWLPMAWDPTMTMLGLDDYRIQRYGPHYEVSVPIADVASRILRAPDAVGKAILGEHLSAGDRSALLAIPFLRTLGLGEWYVDRNNAVAEGKIAADTAAREGRPMVDANMQALRDAGFIKDKPSNAQALKDAGYVTDKPSNEQALKDAGYVSEAKTNEQALKDAGYVGEAKTNEQALADAGYVDAPQQSGDDNWQALKDAGFIQ